MSSNKSIANYAILAEAAYAELSNVIFTDRDNVITALEQAYDDKDGISKIPKKLAEYIVNNYQIIAHYKDRSGRSNNISDVADSVNPESGFSATLFQSTNNKEEYVLSIRGTQGWKDLIATDGGDIVRDGIAYEQVIDMYNFYHQMIAKSDESYQIAISVKDEILSQKYANSLKALSEVKKDADNGIGNPESIPRIMADIASIEDGLKGKGYFLDGTSVKKINFVDSKEYYGENDERALGLGVLTGKEKLIISGHSLGGHLAASFSRLFPDVVEHTYMVNGAGFGTKESITGKTSNSISFNISEIFKVLGGADQFDKEKITNLIGDKNINVVASDWDIGLSQPGKVSELFIEEAGFGKMFGHAAGQMSDTMQAASLFFAMDGKLNQTDLSEALKTLNPVFEAVTNDDEETLEKVVYQIGKLLLGDKVPEQAATRNELYERIASLKALLTGKKDAGEPEDAQGGKYQFVSLATDQSGWKDNVSQNSDKGTALRYALRELNPFAVVGADYTAHNRHGNLNLYSIENPYGMTDTYLQHRAAMLAWKNAINTVNVSYSDDFGAVNFNYTEIISAIAATGPLAPLTAAVASAISLLPADLKGDWTYEDKSGNLSFHIDGNNLTDLSNHYVRFGSDTIDELKGGDLKDYLFGAGGNDTLNGGDGDDYMEGGQGLDTYIIKDHDTVFDSDMQGKILFDNGGKPIQIDRFESGGEPNPVIWHSPDRQFTAIRYGKDLIVSSKSDKSDKVTVKDFFKIAKDNGKGGLTGLGIELDKAELLKPGMQKRLTGIANRYNNFHANSGAHTEIIGGSLSDTVLPASSSIWAEMGDGNDRVYGSMSADMIDGGDGNDILNGSSFVPAGTNKPQAELDKDADIIIGGNGHDLIIGMAGDDTIYTGKKDEHKETKPTGMRGDWALGHLGDDTIYGSRGQDFLQGGEGSDIIHGGADDDVILGDSFIRFGSRNVLEKGVIPDAIVVPKYEHGYSTIGVENLPGKAIGFTHNAQTDKRIAEYAVSIPSPQSFEWSLSIDKEKGDYVLDTSKGVPLSDNRHLVEKDGAADYLYGGTGNDLIIGQTGDDFLFGEKGNDILWGDDNRDLSVAGNDYLDGGEGNDTLYGGLGNDTLTGGTGSNTLDGGEGFDTYVITREEFAQTAATPAEKKTHNIIRDSDGQGKILIQDMDLGSLHWQLNKGTGKWSARGQEIALAQNGSDLLLQNKDGITVATVSNFQNGHLGITLPGFTAQTDKPKSEPAPMPQPVQPEPIQPQPVQPQPVQPQLVQPQPVQPAPATQTVIEGGSGNETLHAAVSGSLVKARGGNDWVHGNAGNDTLIGGAGNDVLYGRAGHDELYGENGDDRLYGGEGDDKLAGGRGNDYLAGGAGSDRYVIERNFGKDFIMNLDTSPNSTDTLRITDGYTPDDFTFKRDGDNLVITEKADNRNEITVHKHFSANYHGAYAIDRIVFDNQKVLDTQAVNALVRQDAALANAANHMVQAMAGFGAGSGATAGNLMQNAAHQPLLLATSSV